MFGLASTKKLQEANTRITDLQKELTEVKEKRRIAESTYMFSGDLTPGVTGQTKEDRSDLNRNDYWTLQRQCYDVFKIFPYAKRVIEMITDFTIGAEPSFNVDKAVDDKYKGRITGILNDLWLDDDNNFDLMLEGMVNELWVLGEQIYPVTVEEMTGILKLGIVDPRMVEKILRANQNEKRLSKIVLKPNIDGKQNYYGVINEVGGRLDVMPESKTPAGVSSYYSAQATDYSGDAFLFQVNRLPTQTRGYSELATMVETLDALDQFVFQVSERSLLMFHYIADVMIKGMSEEDVKKYPVPDPKKNSIFKHSQNVEMKLQTPDVKAVDADMISRMIIRYVLAGVGIPEHWIVSGENTNLATAREQNNPIERRLERRQGLVKYMLKRICRYQLERRMKDVSANEMKEIMGKVVIDLPAVAGIDRKLRAQVMTETAKALVIGVAQGWIDNADAGNEFVKLANRYGTELENINLDEQGKQMVKSVTGKSMDTLAQVDSYFKAVDTVTKQQGSMRPGLLDGKQAVPVGAAK